MAGVDVTRRGAVTGAETSDAGMGGNGVPPVRSAAPKSYSSEARSRREPLDFIEVCLFIILAPSRNHAALDKFRHNQQRKNPHKRAGSAKE